MCKREKENTNNLFNFQSPLMNCLWSVLFRAEVISNKQLCRNINRLSILSTAESHLSVVPVLDVVFENMMFRPVLFCSITLPSIGMDPNCTASILNT